MSHTHSAIRTLVTITQRNIKFAQTYLPGDLQIQNSADPHLLRKVISSINKTQKLTIFTPISVTPNSEWNFLFKNSENERP